MRKPSLILAAAVAVVAVASFAAADMFLQGIAGDHAISARSDRFHAGPDRAFIGEPFDWSGVGRSSNGAWVTMISPTHFVSANHYHPNAGDTITFYEGNSLAGRSHAYTVDGFGYDTNYGGQSSDLWLGRLTAPLSPKHHIATYPVLSLGADGAYTDMFMYAYGYPNRVGTSRIGAIVDDFEIGRTRTMRFWFHAAEGTGTGPTDCHLIGGDSGGPSFVLVGGRLALVGIHFTTNDTNGVPDPEDSWPFGFGWSGDSFVPFYIDQLNANMGAERVRVIRSRADFTLDGKVDSADLAALLGAWGESSATHDLDGDGVVGSPDLALLLADWG
jgi:hypothetical protein